jgi:hypothetical protein
MSFNTFILMRRHAAFNKGVSRGYFTHLVSSGARPVRSIVFIELKRGLWSKMGPMLYSYPGNSLKL